MSSTATDALRYVTSERLREIAGHVVAFPGTGLRMSGDSRNIVYIATANGEQVRLFMDDITVRVVSLTLSGVITSEASFSSSVPARLVAAYVSAYVAEGA